MPTFYHSDESSAIDSNSQRIIDIKRGDVIEKYMGCIWNVLTVDEKYLLYCESEVVEKFSSQYGDQFKTPSQSLFHR